MRSSMHCVAVLVLLALSACNAQRLVKEKFRTEAAFPPENWIAQGVPVAREAITITIAVKQQNLDILNQKFWEVSDPSHANYGKFMTHEEVKKLVAPSRESISAIYDWLHAHDVKRIELANSGDFIEATAPVSVIEKLLDVTIMNYVHTPSGTFVKRINQPYTLPVKVFDYIDFVGGITRFPTIKPRTQKSSGSLASVNVQIARNFFQLNSTDVGTNGNNSQAVAQFLEQYYNPQDLASFQSWQGIANQPVVKVVGPNNANRPGIEASLDIEYIIAIAQKVPTWFVSTGGLHEKQEPFLDWVVAMSSDPSSPLVHSVSYGDDESSVTEDYAQRCDVEFQKYGLTGRSILFASGDDGTGCKKCNTFVPGWPATSAYVTAVGGFLTDGTGPLADTISSGGFSNYFGRPSYQNSVVSAYLSAHPNPPTTFFNTTGRAFPDIAAFSEDVMIVNGGSREGVSGTSCATPMVAGIISMLNEARLNAGKSPLGFLNVWLYNTLANHPDAFTDVTRGANANGCCRQGFAAAQGWDPVTGVGVPVFPKLKQYALAA